MKPRAPLRNARSRSSGFRSISSRLRSRRIVRFSAVSSLRDSGQHGDRHSGDTHQVAGGHREFELLIDPMDSPKHSLANASDRLAPAKVLFNSFANSLTELVGGITCCSSVDRTAAATSVVAGDVRRVLALPAVLHVSQTVACIVRA